VKPERLVKPVDLVLLDPEVEMDLKALWVNLESLETWDCLVWWENQVPLVLLDRLDHQVKAKWLQRLFLMVTACLVPLVPVVPWVLQDLQECLEFLVVRVDQVVRDLRVKQVLLENLARMGNLAENIARMIYEKFAHRYCETVWLSLLPVSRDLQVDLVEVTEDQQVLQDQEDQLVILVFRRNWTKRLSWVTWNARTSRTYWT